MHEGLEPVPLTCSPIFTVLTKAVGDCAFRDYGTVEELFEIEIEADEMHRSEFRTDMLDKPFFEASNGSTQKASTVGKDLKYLSLRLGYLNPPTTHDFRAEVLHLIGMSLLYYPMLAIELTYGIRPELFAGSEKGNGRTPR